MIDFLTAWLADRHDFTGWYLVTLVVLSGCGGAAIAITFSDDAGRTHEVRAAEREAAAVRRRQRIRHAVEAAAKTPGVRARPQHPVYAGRVPIDYRRPPRPPRTRARPLAAVPAWVWDGWQAPQLPAGWAPTGVRLD